MSGERSSNKDEKQQISCDYFIKEWKKTMESEQTLKIMTPNPSETIEVMLRLQTPREIQTLPDKRLCLSLCFVIDVGENVITDQYFKDVKKILDDAVDAHDKVAIILFDQQAKEYASELNKETAEAKLSELETFFENRKKNGGTLSENDKLEKLLTFLKEKEKADTPTSDAVNHGCTSSTVEEPKNRKFDLKNSSLMLALASLKKTTDAGYVCQILSSIKQKRLPKLLMFSGGNIDRWIQNPDEVILKFKTEMKDMGMDQIQVMVFSDQKTLILQQISCKLGQERIYRQNGCEQDGTVKYKERIYRTIFSDINLKVTSKENFELVLPTPTDYDKRPDLQKLSANLQKGVQRDIFIDSMAPESTKYFMLTFKRIPKKGDQKKSNKTLLNVIRATCCPRSKKPNGEEVAKINTSYKDSQLETHDCKKKVVMLPKQAKDVKDDMENMKLNMEAYSLLKKASEFSREYDEREFEECPKDVQNRTTDKNLPHLIKEMGNLSQRCREALLKAAHHDSKDFRAKLFLAEMNRIKLKGLRDAYVKMSRRRSVGVYFEEPFQAIADADRQVSFVIDKWKKKSEISMGERLKEAKETFEEKRKLIKKALDVIKHHSKNRQTCHKKLSEKLTGNDKIEIDIDQKIDCALWRGTEEIEYVVTVNGLSSLRCKSFICKEYEKLRELLNTLKEGRRGISEEDENENAQKIKDSSEILKKASKKASDATKDRFRTEQRKTLKRALTIIHEWNLKLSKSQNQQAHVSRCCVSSRSVIFEAFVCAEVWSAAKATLKFEGDEVPTTHFEKADQATEETKYQWIFDLVISNQLEKPPQLAQMESGALVDDNRKRIARALEITRQYSDDRQKCLKKLEANFESGKGKVDFDQKINSAIWRGMKDIKIVITEWGDSKGFEKLTKLLDPQEEMRMDKKKMHEKKVMVDVATAREKLKELQESRCKIEREFEPQKNLPSSDDPPDNGKKIDCSIVAEAYTKLLAKMREFLTLEICTRDKSQEELLSVIEKFQEAQKVCKADDQSELLSNWKELNKSMERTYALLEKNSCEKKKEEILDVIKNFPKIHKDEEENDLPSNWETSDDENLKKAYEIMEKNRRHDTDDELLADTKNLQEAQKRCKDEGRKRLRSISKELTELMEVSDENGFDKKTSRLVGIKMFQKATQRRKHLEELDEIVENSANLMQKSGSVKENELLKSFQTFQEAQKMFKSDNLPPNREVVKESVDKVYALLQKNRNCARHFRIILLENVGCRNLTELNYKLYLAIFEEMEIVEDIILSSSNVHDWKYCKLKNLLFSLEKMKEVIIKKCDAERRRFSKEAKKTLKHAVKIMMEMESDTLKYLNNGNLQKISFEKGWIAHRCIIIENYIEAAAWSAAKTALTLYRSTDNQDEKELLILDKKLQKAREIYFEEYVEAESWSGWKKSSKEFDNSVQKACERLSKSSSGFKTKDKTEPRELQYAQDGYHSDFLNAERRKELLIYARKLDANLQKAQSIIHKYRFDVEARDKQLVLEFGFSSTEKMYVALVETKMEMILLEEIDQILRDSATIKAEETSKKEEPLTTSTYGKLEKGNVTIKAEETNKLEGQSTTFTPETIALKAIDDVIKITMKELHPTGSKNFKLLDNCYQHMEFKLHAAELRMRALKFQFSQTETENYDEKRLNKLIEVVIKLKDIVVHENLTIMEDDRKRKIGFPTFESSVDQAEKIADSADIGSSATIKAEETSKKEKPSTASADEKLKRKYEELQEWLKDVLSSCDKVSQEMAAIETSTNTEYARIHKKLKEWLKKVVSRYDDVIKEKDKPKNGDKSEFMRKLQEWLNHVVSSYNDVRQEIAAPETTWTDVEYMSKSNGIDEQSDPNQRESRSEPEIFPKVMNFNSARLQLVNRGIHSNAKRYTERCHLSERCKQEIKKAESHFERLLIEISSKKDASDILKLLKIKNWRGLYVKHRCVKMRHIALKTIAVITEKGGPLQRQRYSEEDVWCAAKNLATIKIAQRNVLREKTECIDNFLRQERLSNVSDEWKKVMTRVKRCFEDQKNVTTLQNMILQEALKPSDSVCAVEELERKCTEAEIVHAAYQGLHEMEKHRNLQQLRLIIEVDVRNGIDKMREIKSKFEDWMMEHDETMIALHKCAKDWRKLLNAVFFAKFQQSINTQDTELPGKSENENSEVSANKIEEDIDDPIKNAKESLEETIAKLLGIRPRGKFKMTVNEIKTYIDNALRNKKELAAAAEKAGIAAIKITKEKEEKNPIRLSQDSCDSTSIIENTCQMMIAFVTMSEIKNTILQDDRQIITFPSGKLMDIRRMVIDFVKEEVARLDSVQRVNKIVLNWERRFRSIEVMVKHYSDQADKTQRKINKQLRQLEDRHDLASSSVEYDRGAAPDNQFRKMCHQVENGKFKKLNEKFKKAVALVDLQEMNECFKECRQLTKRWRKHDRDTIWREFEWQITKVRWLQALETQDRAELEILAPKMNRHHRDTGFPNNEGFSNDEKVMDDILNQNYEKKTVSLDLRTKVVDNGQQGNAVPDVNALDYFGNEINTMKRLLQNWSQKSSTEGEDEVKTSILTSNLSSTSPETGNRDENKVQTKSTRSELPGTLRETSNLDENKVQTKSRRSDFPSTSRETCNLDKNEVQMKSTTSESPTRSHPTTNNGKQKDYKENLFAELEGKLRFYDILRRLRCRKCPQSMDEIENALKEGRLYEKEADLDEDMKKKLSEVLTNTEQSLSDLKEQKQDLEISLSTTVEDFENKPSNNRRNYKNTCNYLNIAKSLSDKCLAFNLHNDQFEDCIRKAKTDVSQLETQKSKLFIKLKIKFYLLKKHSTSSESEIVDIKDLIKKIEWFKDLLSAEENKYLEKVDTYLSTNFPVHNSKSKPTSGKQTGIEPSDGTKQNEKALRKKKSDDSDLHGDSKISEEQTDDTKPSWHGSYGADPSNNTKKKKNTLQKRDDRKPSWHENYGAGPSNNTKKKKNALQKRDGTKPSWHANYGADPSNNTKKKKNALQKRDDRKPSWHENYGTCPSNNTKKKKNALQKRDDTKLSWHENYGADPSNNTKKKKNALQKRKFVEVDLHKAASKISRSVASELSSYNSPSQEVRNIAKAVGILQGQPAEALNRWQKLRRIFVMPSAKVGSFPHRAKTLMADDTAVKQAEEILKNHELEESVRKSESGALLYALGKTKINDHKAKQESVPKPSVTELCRPLKHDGIDRHFVLPYIIPNK